jgi:hypothetical protein
VRRAAWSSAAAVDDAGVLHILAAHYEGDTPDALLYLSRPKQGDEFAVTTVAPAGGFVSGMALDGVGRPHVVFVVERNYELPASLEPGLYYTAGPS